MMLVQSDAVKMLLCRSRFSVFLFFALPFRDLIAAKNMVLLVGTNEVLECVGNSNSNDLFFWDDESTLSPPTRLVTVDSSGIEETNAFKSDAKYNNFAAESSFPQAVNMTLEPVDLNDAGSYRCQVVRAAKQFDYTVQLEAKPRSVSVSCVSSTSSCQSPDENEMSTVSCNCTAVGAYPDYLKLMWDFPDGTQTQPVPSSERPGTFDFTSSIVIQVDESKPSVSCQLMGYNNTIELNERSDTNNFSPPNCTLDIDCSEAMITCSCKNASPEDIKYSFYDKDSQPINVNPVTSNQMKVQINQGENNTFYCWGCNGINYGDNSFVNSTIYCPSTTTIPSTTTDSTTVPTLIDFTSRSTISDGDNATTTPTMTLMATSTPESDNLGLIIGVVIAAVVVGGGAIGFSVYWFGIRTSDQESVKRSNNEVGISTANKEKSDKLLYESTGNNFDPPGGADNNTVTASTNETTNSAAPVYGVVNKSTKKKSDNTDGNGVNSKLQSEPDQVEYAAVNKPKSDPQPAPRSSKPPGNNTEPEKVELQYADIDHSNRGRSNEIHQPADAPTEYATVQSVIV